MDEREQLKHAIAVQESLRATLGDTVVNTTIAALQRQLASLESERFPEQRKLVTVLFCDLANFTPLAETMDPEDVRAILNSYFQPWRKAIDRHGGMVEKFIGDAVMAVFGIPTASEQDPENAICAALEVRDGLSLLNADLHQRYGISLAMRVGINSGTVLVSEMGRKGDFTVTGDTVNLASRLEGKAPINGILIAHNTYRHVRGVFDVVPQEPITVKGKKNAVQAYVVKRKKPRTFRGRTVGVEGMEIPMIGRETEFRHLQDAFHTVIEDREMRMVTIAGEAGLGKSRMLDEFQDWVDLQSERFRLFKGRANEQTRNLPYFLIRDLFAFRFQIAESDPLRVVHAKMEQGIARFMGTGHTEQAHFIGHLLGYHYPDSPYLRGILDDPKQIRTIALHYLTQFFVAVTRQQPAALLLEDLHWADDGSLEILQHLVQTCREYPLLIVGCTRPLLFERHPLWADSSTWFRTGEQEQYIHMKLRPLSKQDSHHLVGEILQHIPDIPTELRDLIVNSAEGNPFYVEELIKMLIEEGVILKERDPSHPELHERWRVATERLMEITIPPTLFGVLQARLDRLPARERDVLQHASVIGRVFWDKAVKQLMTVRRSQGSLNSGTPSTQRTYHIHDIRNMLDASQSRELIFERETSAFETTREYLFKHALLRDVTYESVLLRQRRELHAQAAVWLMKQSGERVEEFAGLIGEHYERARKSDKAIEWYGRAGKQAQNAYVPETAMVYYQKALALLDDQTCEAAETAEFSEHRIILYEGLGAVLQFRSQYAEAIEAYTAMRNIAQAVADVPAQVRAWLGLAWAQLEQGEYRASLESAEHAESIALTTDRTVQKDLATALNLKGGAFFRLGDFEQALAVVEEALALGTELEAKREMAHSLNIFGLINTVLGRYDQAAAYFERALAIDREIGNREWETTMVNNLAEIARLRGAYRSALQGYQEAFALAQEIGYRDEGLLYLNNIGGARVELGDYVAAETDLRQVIQMAGTGAWILAETLSFLAQACLGQGKVEEAWAAARQAMRLSQESGNPIHLGLAWQVLGQIAVMEPIIRLGKVDYTAAECFAESLRVYKENGIKGFQVQTLKAWARSELEQGNRTKGEALWQEARTLCKKLSIEIEEPLEFRN